MKVIKETLWQRLVNRLPANDAARVKRILKRAGACEEIDYMTVKALSEMVESYQLRARTAIRDYRRWRAREGVQHLAAAGRAREGAVLRHMARESAGLYLDVRRDYNDLIDLAMQRYSPANDTDGTE